MLAVLLAFPLQVAVLFVAQLGNDLADVGPSAHIGAYACTNFVHGSTPFRCNLRELVRNAAEGAVLLDCFTFGVAFIVTALAVAVLFIGVRKLRLRIRARPNTSLERTRER
jgi:hypothetical protein